MKLFLQRHIRRFIRNVKGVATVEFAIVGPVLVALLIFSVNGFDAYRGVRRASTAVDIVSDIASRKAAIDSTQRDALFVTAEALLDNYATGAIVEVIISSVEQDADDNYVVLWSVANDNATAHAGTLPTDLTDELPAIPTGESLIITELDFSFQPVFQDLWVGGITIDQFSIARPRTVAQIAYNP